MTEHIQADLSELLIVDDKEGNRRAAKEIFGDAIFAQSSQEALEYLTTHTPTFCITDMDMETPISGLYVAEAALKKCIPTLTASHTGPGHSGEIVTVIPYKPPLKSYEHGKASTDFWSDLNEFLHNPDSSLESYLRVSSLIRENGGSLFIDRTTTAICHYPDLVGTEHKELLREYIFTKTKE